ncbi:hypothetical protein CLOM_g15578 [Closterium sp. NIES-68]|nr:hypothetical protein CLOM_g15578 [Closterium sp. NIES-68]GJP79548.1 hypothetical protein CLOP_g9771 [Closterium sp. NIES-67]
MGGLTAVDQRASDGGPVLEPGEEGEPGEVLLHSQPDVGLVLGESDVDESGSLYITSKRVVWQSSLTPRGVAVSLVDLSMHAISRDLDAYPKPCIYTQVDSGDWEDEEEDEEEEEEEEGEEEGEGGAGAAEQANHVGGSGGGAGGRREGEEDEEMREAEGEAVGSDAPAAASAGTGGAAGGSGGAAAAAVGNGNVAHVFEHLSLVSEMRLVPRDEAALEAIFKALCDSAALNPDPEGAEQEGEGEWFYNEDEVLRNARIVLPEGDPGQFEDADEEDEGEEEEGAGAAAGS